MYIGSNQSIEDLYEKRKTFFLSDMGSDLCGKGVYRDSVIFYYGFSDKKLRCEYSCWIDFFSSLERYHVVFGDIEIY